MRLARRFLSPLLEYCKSASAVAEALVLTRNFSSAEQALRDILKAAPKGFSVARPSILLAQTLLMQAKADEIPGLCDNALAVDSTDTTAFHALLLKGQALLLSNQHDPAIESLQAALAISERSSFPASMSVQVLTGLSQAYSNKDAALSRSYQARSRQLLDTPPPPETSNQPAATENLALTPQFLDELFNTDPSRLSLLASSILSAAVGLSQADGGAVGLSYAKTAAHLFQKLSEGGKGSASTTQMYAAANSLVSFFHAAGGRVDEAISSALLAAISLKGVEGAELQLSSILQNLGILHQRKVAHRDASQFFSDAINLRRKKNGEKHPSLAPLYVKFAQFAPPRRCG
jgi:tetratricopeptide (TPR) repeat protein